MKKEFSENLKYLRESKGLKQSQMLGALGIKATTWNNYESGTSQPNLDVLLLISKYFDVSESDLLHSDLKANAHLIRKKEKPKNQENAHPNAHLIAHPIDKKGDNQQELKISFIGEPDDDLSHKNTVIPITDISVAAGAGHYNHEYIEHLDSIKLPISLTRKNATYLCVKIKGHSMSPTLQDGGYVIIRLLDNGEWLKLHEERIYVVSDREGKAYLKRIKNRFKQGFIVLMSDNPDKASFPNFNLEANEILTIWYVEWYLSAKMPNIHDQYYPRLQRLEEKVDLLLRGGPKM